MAAALLGVGVEAGELLVDLALEVARVGGDPDRGAVALRPEAGGRDVAQRLAGAGAGLREDEGGLALHLARGEGEGGRGGVVRLGGARSRRPRRGFRPGARGLRGRHGVGAGRGRGGRLLPVRQAAPDLQRVGRGARVGWPRAARTLAAQGQSAASRRRAASMPASRLQRGVAGGGEAAEEVRRDLRQQDRRRPRRPSGGRGPARAPGRAAWGRRAGRAGRRRRARAGRRRRGRGRCPGGARWRGRGRGSAGAGPAGGGRGRARTGPRSRPPGSGGWRGGCRRPARARPAAEGGAWPRRGASGGLYPLCSRRQVRGHPSLIFQTGPGWGILAGMSRGRPLPRASRAGIRA